MSVPANPYAALEARFHRLGALRDATAILSWDRATLMPKGGAAPRAEQIAALKLVCHEILTDPALPDLLEGAGGQNDLDPWRAANLREMRRAWIHAAAVPADLVEALAKACSTCEMLWREARPASDFALVRPALQAVLGLVRELGAAKADRLGKSAYEALLDEYEPDGSTSEIDRLFDQVAGFLPEFIAAALERQAALPPPTLPAGPFPIATQQALGLRLMA